MRYLVSFSSVSGIILGLLLATGAQAQDVAWVERMGGTLNDGGYGIAVDARGNAYVTGAFDSLTADFGPYTLTSAGGVSYRPYDIFVEKLDNGGSVLWAERMGGTSSDFGNGIAVDASGDPYVTGSFESRADFGPYTLFTAGGPDIFVEKLGPCGDFVDPSSYGRLLFLPFCTENANTLPGGPGDPFIYNRRTLSLFKGPRDRIYLSREGDTFSSLVVDDAVHVNGLDSGLAPYQLQPGVPPWKYNVPIEENLVPEPAQEVSNLIPVGESDVLFELLDTDREIYGNTPVYLVVDCGITVQGTDPTTIDFKSHDDIAAGTPTTFDVVSGYLSNLRASGGFSDASCLGVFSSSPATDSRANPAAGDGYYYLARGRSSCAAQGYGDSGLVPDPRDSLEAASPCP